VMNAGVGNAIGGWRPFPGLGTIDSQIAEDFTLADDTTLTLARVDIMAYDGTVPAEGVWVQVYADADGKPAQDVTLEWVAAPADFQAVEIDSPLSFRAWRLNIDLTPGGFELPAGTWWVNFQPLDIETSGDWFWAIGAVEIPPIGHPSHVRDGWEAHGNDFYGLWGSTVWAPHNFRGNAVLSWRLEGDAGADCTGRERLSATCAERNCGARVLAKVKKGLPGAQLRFRIDGIQEVPGTVNQRGKARVIWCPAGPGPHTVEVVECGLTAQTDCP